MVTLAKHILVVVGLLAAFLGIPACSTSPTKSSLTQSGWHLVPAGYPSSAWQFEPIVADAEVRFTVVDGRREEDTRFRMLGQTEPRYAYGDDQFFPTRMRVVATHFADAFPRDSAAAHLLIERLDVIDYVPRPLGDGQCSGDGMAMFCVPLVLVGRAMAPERNSVTCYLSGSYAGTPFSSSAKVNYDKTGSMEHGKAVAGVLLAASTSAISEVRVQRRRSFEQNAPVRPIGFVVIRPKP
jgi:hypothetical protein